MNVVRLAYLTSLASLVGACAPYPEFSGVTEVVTLESKQVSDSFEIHIELPPGYDRKAGPYPVMYLLDGSVHAEPVAAMAEAIDAEVIIVGIGYDDGISPIRRRRDYTPTEDPNYERSGGADAFFEFVIDDVIPQIEGDHAIDSGRRTLAGHSQGGLAVSYQALSQDPGDLVFSSFVAASPALWWDKGFMLDLEDAYAEDHDDLPVTMFTTVADIETVAIWGYALEFYDRVQDRDYEGLDLQRENYPRTTHDASWIRAYEDALEYIHGN